MRKEKKNDEGKNNMYKQIDQSMMMKMMVCKRNWQRRGVRKLIRKDKYKCFIAAAQTDTDENEEKEHERR